MPQHIRDSLSWHGHAGVVINSTSFHFQKGTGLGDKLHFPHGLKDPSLSKVQIRSWDMTCCAPSRQVGQFVLWGKGPPHPVATTLSTAGGDDAVPSPARLQSLESGILSGQHSSPKGNPRVFSRSLVCTAGHPLCRPFGKQKHIQIPNLGISSISV